MSGCAQETRREMSGCAQETLKGCAQETRKIRGCAQELRTTGVRQSQLNMGILWPGRPLPSRKLLLPPVIRSPR